MMTTEPTHLPCPDALIAGTVALMTAWAAPCSSCSLDVDHQRPLFARKLLSNLLLLQQHPALSPGLRQVMAQAHARWSRSRERGRSEHPAHRASSAVDR